MVPALGPPSLSNRLPAGISVERATPALGGDGGFWRAPSPPARWRTSAEKMRVALSTIPPLPVRRHDASCERGTREAQPRFPLSQPTRGIRANPLPIRLSRQGPDHSSEGLPSESAALWWSKACATWCATSVSHPLFVSGPPLRRHVLDPRRRKSSIISRPLAGTVSCAT